MDERLLRIYRFLVQMERLTIEDIPEPYRTAMQEDLKT